MNKIQKEIIRKLIKKVFMNMFQCSGYNEKQFDGKIEYILEELIKLLKKGGDKL